MYVCLWVPLSLPAFLRDVVQPQLSLLRRSGYTDCRQSTSKHCGPMTRHSSSLRHHDTVPHSTLMPYLSSVHSIAVLQSSSDPQYPPERAFLRVFSARCTAVRRTFCQILNDLPSPFLVELHMLAPKFVGWVLPALF